jgi:hypothetical protein
VHGGTRENGLASMGIERHEENRRIEALEDQFQPRWLAFDDPLRSKCCSVRCRQRTSSCGWRRRACSAETADAAAKSAETADATAKSAEDSGRYSTSRLGHAFRRFA